MIIPSKCYPVSQCLLISLCISHITVSSVLHLCRTSKLNKNRLPGLLKTEDLDGHISVSPASPKAF